jgi:hypothetical protein
MPRNLVHCLEQTLVAAMEAKLHTCTAWNIRRAHRVTLRDDYSTSQTELRSLDQRRLAGWLAGWLGADR